MPLVVLFWAAVLAVVGAYAVCDWVARQLRLSRYRRRWRRVTRPLDGSAR